MSGGAEPILLSILLIIVGAKLGGEAAERLKQPAVLGELLVGIVLGASLLGGVLGMPDFGEEQVLNEQEDALHDAEEAVAEAEAHEAAVMSDPNATQQDRMAAANATSDAKQDLHGTETEFGAYIGKNGDTLGAIEVLGILATLGVILLLFEVGLESDIKELTKVGKSALVVAAIGIVFSFIIGYGFSAGLSSIWPTWATADEALPANLLHIFMGATLTATSVGITARVLGDMGKLNSNETRIILGAAVIDDIGGLIILAIVAALVAAAASGNAVDVLGLVLIAVKAIGFLVVSLLVGLRFIPKAYDSLVDRFKVGGFPVALAFAFALLMAYLATLAGLADIVGAFAGGLILAQTKHAHRIFEDLRPIAAIFVSFFFVTLGMKVNLTQMDGNGMAVLVIGIVLTVLAMVAKLACGFGVLKDAKASRWVVGVGMSPRGEVGLIFALLGLETGLIENWQYTAVILVVMLTTFITPIWLTRLKDAFIGDQEGEAGEKLQDATRILKV